MAQLVCVAWGVSKLADQLVNGGSLQAGRAYYNAAANELAAANSEHILGALANRLPFALEPSQRAAWLFQIQHLQAAAPSLPGAHFFFEFVIPRMGRRVDVIVLHRGALFVIEYKIGSRDFGRHAIEQVHGYALDLKHFHETSHEMPIVPILIATEADTVGVDTSRWDFDNLHQPLLLSGQADLSSVINGIADQAAATGANSLLSASAWSSGRYKPTPTIIEAAQALYRGHDVHEISRSEAGAENLTITADYISEVIETAKANNRKIICFVTGVPGSGKTLAGLNIANERMQGHADEHAVFLSGNGPLVEVLRKALSDDGMARSQSGQITTTRAEETRKAAAFIQNIHHFRDEALDDPAPPVGKVVVFDEAQRAWDVAQTSEFMRGKRGQVGFNQSEPQFLLSVMDRHRDWCAVVCLIGGGQEINTGEAGLAEWLRVLHAEFPHWEIHLSPDAMHEASEELSATTSPALHLATSVRSFRAEKLSEFVSAILDGSPGKAAELAKLLHSYPLALTRSLPAARLWLRQRTRATERMGLLASSNAMRLKPEGIHVKAKVDPPLWFLAPGSDVRSSNALEDAATEFEVQGLELDWTAVCWDSNLRREGNQWVFRRFRGTRWEMVNDAARRSYLLNSYRVLLTRARQGMIIFIPVGDPTDPTRDPSQYDATAAYLVECGVPSLDLDPLPRRSLS